MKHYSASYLIPLLAVLFLCYNVEIDGQIFCYTCTGQTSDTGSGNSGCFPPFNIDSMTLVGECTYCETSVTNITGDGVFYELSCGSQTTPPVAGCTTAPSVVTCVYITTTNATIAGYPSTTPAPSAPSSLTPQIRLHHHPRIIRNKHFYIWIMEDRGP